MAVDEMNRWQQLLSLLSFYSGLHVVLWQCCRWWSAFLLYQSEPHGTKVTLYCVFTQVMFGFVLNCAVETMDSDLIIVSERENWTVYVMLHVKLFLMLLHWPEMIESVHVLLGWSDIHSYVVLPASTLWVCSWDEIVAWKQLGYQTSCCCISRFSKTTRILQHLSFYQGWI